MNYAPTVQEKLSAVLPVHAERFPIFRRGPIHGAPIYTHGIVWIYTLEIGAGCPMKDGGRNELRPYGAGETIRCATTSSYGTFPGFVGAPFMAPPYTQVSVWIYTVKIRIGMSHEGWRA